MVVFPNAKINLGLFVERKRGDGYHDICTCFYPLKQLYDVLEVIEASNDNFSLYGKPVLGSVDDNLVVRAIGLVRASAKLPPLEVHLLKNIPMGAGLGGGSADGAFTLRLLCEKFDLTITQAQMHNMALQLGSDCPFFLQNRPAIGRGRGDELEPIDLTSLSGKFLILVNPGIHVPTAAAYALIKPKPAPNELGRMLVESEVAEWKNFLYNDFEEPIFKKYPEIGLIKATLINHGALYASMSGSGSSVFGIFDSPVEIQFPLHYAVFKLVL